MSQEISQDDTFCIHCGESSHLPDNCPFNQEYDGQLENTHYHKAGSSLEEETRPIKQSDFGESVGLALNRALESGHKLSCDGGKV